jgi:hypothetical protein
MPKDIRLIGHIATFRNVFGMIFLNHSYAVIKKKHYLYSLFNQINTFLFHQK